MRLFLLAVGRIKAAHFRQATDDYLLRLGHHFEVTELEIRDVSRRGEIAQCRQKEAADLLAALPAFATLVALDEAGRGWSSQQLAEWIADRRDRGERGIAFAIGGPDGLCDSVRQRAARLWSLGPQTMPHELCRVVLAEQLYRAATIIARTPYHR